LLKEREKALAWLIDEETENVGASGG